MPPVTHAPRRGTDHDMDYTIPILLFSLCAIVRGEPLPEALQRRSDGGRGVYAAGHSRDYEPYVYAAIPLHSPIPVLHVLSQALDQHRAQTANRPTYAHPPNRYGQPPRYGSSYPYAASMSYVMYTNPPDPEESAPTILYARPNPDGGYTYRRPRPVKKRAPPKRPPSEPVIIKIHKYRIIRDR